MFHIGDGSVLVTLVVEIDFESGEHVTLRVPETGISNLAESIRQLSARHEGRASLGLDVPTFDLFLRLTEQSQVLVDVVPDPLFLGVVQQGVASVGETIRNELERLRDLLKLSSEGEATAWQLIGSSIEKLSSSVMISGKSEPGLPLGDIAFHLRELHFWTRSRELLEALQRLIRGSRSVLPQSSVSDLQSALEALQQSVGGQKD
ncbi:MAG TPA: hypothetical protein VEM77_05575 [Thermoplasmata archaeon]|nr:hypothetical protein [Thermoplasmata archaeon]